MKATFLFLAAMTAFAVAVAQEKPYLKILERFKTSRNQTFVQPKSDRLLTAPQVELIPKPKLLQVLSNGNKVYALSQDRMPCVIPEMYGYNMPNKAVIVVPYRYNGPGAIPNPAKPFQK
jgi:hypothetical protein